VVLGNLSTNPRSLDTVDAVDAFIAQSNEALSEIINEEIHRSVPGLGTFATKGLYKAWHGLWRFMEGQGMSLVPAFGFKLADFSFSGDFFKDDKYQWYCSLTDELTRVFNPKDIKNLWRDFCANVKTLSERSDPYSEDPAPFISLLPKVGRLKRAWESFSNRDANWPRANQPYGRYLLDRGGTVKTFTLSRGEIHTIVKP
jgi:hypothetical protein